MARIRTIKPDLFKHEELYDLEKETGLPLRFAFAGLFTCADREGRFKWKPRTLKLDALPHDDLDFSRVLDALSTRDFIRKYVIGGEEYGVITTFHKHQVINNREADSEIPPPTESSYVSTTSTRAARVDDASGTPLVRAQAEGKGKEGKGREKEGEGEGEQHVNRRSAPTDRDPDPIPDIFAYWQKTMTSPGSKLDGKRIAKIRAALAMGYTPRQLCEAIKGCSLTPHNMGQNDRNTRYNGIELILRDADHIDRFMACALNPPKAGQPETVEQRNARIMDELLGEDDRDGADTIEMEEAHEH